jgi:putative endonuclease
MNLREIGSCGERIACRYLKSNGYQILQRNYFKSWSAVKKGEIDIVCSKDNVVSFVEVKTVEEGLGNSVGKMNLLSSGKIFPPEEKVNFQKKKKLINLAQSWLEEKKISLDSKWQIDVIAVRIDPAARKAKIRHFRNI